MSVGKPDQNSIRPPPDSSEKGSGLRVEVGVDGQTLKAKITNAGAQRVPVYPVGEKDDGEEIEAV